MLFLQINYSNIFSLLTASYFELEIILNREKFKPFLVFRENILFYWKYLSPNQRKITTKKIVINKYKIERCISLKLLFLSYFCYCLIVFANDVFETNERKRISMEYCEKNGTIYNDSVQLYPLSLNKRRRTSSISISS